MPAEWPAEDKEQEQAPQVAMMRAAPQQALMAAAGTSGSGNISVVPSTLSLALYAGDGFALSLTVSDPNGDALPITGQIKAQIRKGRSDADPIGTFGVDLTNAATGIVRLSLTGAQTGALITTAGAQFKGVWDVQWTPTGSEPMTLVQGTVTCDPDVTR